MLMLTYPTHPREEGISIDVPPALKSALLPWATHHCKQFSFGYLLTQSLAGRDFTLFIFKWIIQDKQVFMYPTVNDGTIALQFTTEGVDIPVELSGDSVSLIPGRYGLFYIPKGSHKAKFLKGTYESIHIELTSEWLEEMAEANYDIGELKLMFEQAASKGKALPPVRIDYQIEKVLFQLRSCAEVGADLLMEFKSLFIQALNIYRKRMADIQKHNLNPQHRYYKEIMQVREGIIDDPSNEISIEVRARKVNMTEKTLSRHFKEYTGEILKDYINKERMRKGRFLVLETKKDLLEITLELGYKDNRIFYQAYKKAYGLTPSTDRKRNGFV